MYFSLPFPETESKDSKLSVTDLLKMYTHSENLDRKMDCKVCERPSKYQKQIDIWKAPNILIFHLKRFKFSG